MNKGKVSDSILRRSVLKYVQQNNSMVNNESTLISEAKVGADCALFTVPSEIIATATAIAVGQGAQAVVEAMLNAGNNLICGGAEMFGVTISIVLPEDTDESELKKIMESALHFAKIHQITIFGGNTVINKEVSQAIITVTALGHSMGYKLKSCKPGMDIVMSKWIGLQGTARIASQKRADLEKRLPHRLLNEAVKFGCAGMKETAKADLLESMGEKYMSVIPEARIAMEQNVCLMHDVSGGGIFRALWELADLTGTGILVELKKIPVRQETIEICEVFGLNPYELLSGGALLMVTEKGEALAEALYAEGIPAEVIGKLTDNNDKALINRSYESEEIRYLERPKTDEIDRIL